MLTACNGALHGEPNFEQVSLIPSLSQSATPVTPKICDSLLNATSEDSSYTGSDADVNNRNACIFTEMAQIDYYYFEYRKSLRSLIDDGFAFGDVVGVGLSTAATAVGGASAKTILSAINVGLGTTKTKIDSDILYSNSINLVLTQMDTDRADWKSRILAQINNPTDDKTYTMYQAADDLLSYYEAGTLDHALSSLTTQTSANLTGCQAAVKSEQTSKALDASPTTTTSGASTCLPQQQGPGSLVPTDLNDEQNSLKGYVSGLSLDQLKALGTKLNIPPPAYDPKGALLLGDINQYIDSATTIDEINALSASIKGD